MEILIIAIAVGIGFGAGKMYRSKQVREMFGVKSDVELKALASK